MNKNFFKMYGASERQDCIVKLNVNKYVVFYGFGKDTPDADTGYKWRKDYDHKPTVAEIRYDIEELVNSQTDAVILSGMVWNGKPVYLSTENQFNFKAAHDLAYQTDGANLPIKFKLGENANGEPVYHTFTKKDVLADFVSKIFSHIQNAIKAGWTEKDSTDYSVYEIDE